MGSMISRYMRDLSEVTGCEIFANEPQQLDFTPGDDKQVVRAVDIDPRSPTADIVRTPIQVPPIQHDADSHDSPISSVLSTRRSYLETDLDSLTTTELVSKPVLVNSNKSEPDSHGAACLSFHLRKLRILEMDPRSPSSEIMRTPIQVPVYHGIKERECPKLQFDDSLSLGSLSSQEASQNSFSMFDFSRDFSDPSAIVSECEDDKDDLQSVTIEEILPELETVSWDAEKTNTEVFDTCSSAAVCIKSTKKLTVFCEEENHESKTQFQVTPENTTVKNVRSRVRTPLTPLCNRNVTPNSIIRAKQSQHVEKEKLTKVKIYNMGDKLKAQTVACFDSNKEGTTRNTLHKYDSKKLANDENTPSTPRQPKLRAQWDHDSSMVI